MKNRSSGNPLLAFTSISIPWAPSTLATSWESEITAVVPSGTIKRASSEGTSSVLSRCMCASINPGIKTKPAASIVSLACQE